MKLEIVKNMGLRWTIYRAQYELKKKFGYLEKTYKPVEIENINIGGEVTKEYLEGKLRKNLSELNRTPQISQKEIDALKIRANKILNSTFQYFNDEWYEFKGWNYSPKTNKYAPDNLHWSKISDFNSDFGDIKWIWELSRFTFAYDLTRAYIYTSDDVYVEKFWNLFEDFIENNPLEIGVNYKCSQEMSFRVNAWMFSLYHMIDHPLSTEKRLNTIIKCISHYADHIYKHINFSVEAVKNNHSISEATTLVILGNILDFLPQSDSLYKRGIKFLKKEISWQIKEDGTFIQHSHNYHRLVLQNLSWYILSSISAKKEISQIVRHKANLSINYFMDVISKKGEVPNYGMNDGSYIMPLTEKSYKDYRPVLQNLNYQLNNNLLFEDESVNEILSLFNKGLDTRSINKRMITPNEYVLNKFGGYHKISYGEFRIYLKSKTYKERPVQADMNHIEIWYDDKCLFGDAGTYSYNEMPEIMNYFNGTISHNTVLINNLNQMKKGSRFIWFNWSKSSEPVIEKTDYGIKIEVELQNYYQYKHRRIVTIENEKVVVDDQVINEKSLDTDLKLQWLTELNAKIVNDEEIDIGDSDWGMNYSSEMNGNTKIFNGDLKEFRGWVSSTYGEKHAVNQIVYNIKSNSKNINIRTVISKWNEE